MAPTSPICGRYARQKVSVHRGGIRVPFFMRYPSKFAGNREMDQMAAHIDLLPTLSQLCGAPLPQDRKIDGRSFVPALQGKDLTKRSFFSYWTRKFPEKYNNVALQRELQTYRAKRISMLNRRL